VLAEWYLGRSPRGRGVHGKLVQVPELQGVDLNWNAFHRRTGQGDKLSMAASSLYTVVALETTQDIPAGTELTWDYREAGSAAVNKGRGWHETRDSEAARL